MRRFIAVVVIIYLIGVGVGLAPIVQARWNNGTPAELFGALAQEMPRALIWPVTLYRNLTGAAPAPSLAPPAPAVAPAPAPAAPTDAPPAKQ